MKTPYKENEKGKESQLHKPEPASPLLKKEDIQFKTRERSDFQESPIRKLSEIKQTVDDTDSMIKISVMDDDKTPDDTPIVIS
jgi:hypothetical protein